MSSTRKEEEKKQSTNIDQKQKMYPRKSLKKITTKQKSKIIFQE